VNTSKLILWSARPLLKPFRQNIYVAIVHNSVASDIHSSFMTFYKIKVILFQNTDTLYSYYHI